MFGLKKNMRYVEIGFKPIEEALVLRKASISLEFSGLKLNNF